MPSGEHPGRPAKVAGRDGWRDGTQIAGKREVKMNVSSYESRNSSGFPTVVRWLFAAFVTITLLAAFAVPVGLAALFLGPMVVVLGIGMFAVWIARRHRQTLQGRDADERKDPFTADRRWPSEGIIDDRLDDPLAAPSNAPVSPTPDRHLSQSPAAAPADALEVRR